MATVKVKLNPDDPPRFTAEELARQDAMTDAEITAAAESDPDNPPLTDAELAQVRAIRAAKAARAAAGLSQGKFAAAFHINPARLRDLEQGRYTPDETLVSYLRVIAADPQAALRALAA